MSKIRLNKKRYNILNGEEVYKLYWIEMGTARSNAKVAKHLQSKGIYNQGQGKRVTDMAIWNSMWRWAIENSDEAYHIFNKAQADEGKFFTKQDWEEFLEEKMMTIMKRSTKKVEKWKARIQRQAAEA